MTGALPPPFERIDQIGRADLESRLRAAMAEGVLNHGWIFAGPKGAGKATLAYRVARGLLDPAALSDDMTFDMQPAARTARLVAQQAHPDLFAAERQWDERHSRYQTEITIDTIRKLIQFLNKTAALGGYRAAIIDTADDLNINAANALLKALEEPPKNTIIILLSEAPGRLIATLRSRCRRIDLRPLPQDEIIALLESEQLAKGAEAARIAEHSGGRPGYALSLASSEGAEAIQLAAAFLSAARKGGGLSKISAGLVGKSADGKWRVFSSALLQDLSDAARRSGAGGAIEGPLAGLPAQNLVRAWENLSSLSRRGDALNFDRGQLLNAMAYDFRAAISDS